MRKKFEFDFSGQTVLVTGATRGIGEQLASDFGECGAKLILTGTKREQVGQLNQLIKQEGSSDQKQYYCVDFSDDKSLEDFSRELKKYSRIDVLVNNAAYNHNNLLADTKIEDWDGINKVDLKAPWLLIRELGPRMKKNGYGRIVNIASVLGSGVSFPGRSIYSSVKTGLIGMTKSVSLELAPEVLVNAVSPGFVDTEMTRTNLSPDKITKLDEQIPIKRLAVTRDISTAVLFLASSLNSYICGQNLIVDGGYVNL